MKISRCDDIYFITGLLTASRRPDATRFKAISNWILAKFSSYLNKPELLLNVNVVASFLVPEITTSLNVNLSL